MVMRKSSSERVSLFLAERISLEGLFLFLYSFWSPFAIILVLQVKEQMMMQNGVMDFPGKDELNTVLPMEVTEEVVRHYSPMVYRIALTKVQSVADAEDIFQEVFLKLVMNEKPFDSEEHRKAWLIKVTVNCCNSHFVAPWKKHVTSLDDAMLSMLPDEKGEDFLQEEGPDVYAEVLKLPQNMREVILLFYYEDMSIRQIAEALQTSETNIKKRLSRARQKLRLEIEAQDI